MKKIVWLLLLTGLASNAMLSQMEMGQTKGEVEERSTLQACGDCICDPNFCFNIVLLNKTFELALDKTWTSIVQPGQTAFAPMVYASAMALNAALLAGVSLSHFRAHKFKPKAE